jgi:hypothetical protein
MQMKQKLIVGLLAAGLAAPALATIQDSSLGDGELFWTIIDPNGERSYTRDLGVTMSQFLAGVSTGQSWSVGADANLSSFIAGTDPANLGGLIWNLAAMDGVGQNRYLTSGLSVPVASGATVTPGVTGNLAFSGTILRSFNDNADIYLSSVNASSSGAPNFSTHGSSTATNGSNVATVADAEAYGGYATWSTDWGAKAVNTAGFDNSVSVIGGSTPLWLLQQNGTSTSLASQFIQLAYNGAPYEAKWTGTELTITAVPEPGTYALMAAGLVGVASLARRRKA